MKFEWKQSGLLITAFAIVVFIVACQKQSLEPVSSSGDSNNTEFSKALSDTVVIDDFYGEFVYGEGVVLIWHTYIEENNAGFHVWRSPEDSTDYERLTTVVIPSMAGIGSYLEYTYIDRTYELGHQYYFKIEAVLSSGLSIFFGPIRIICLDIKPFLPKETSLYQNYPNPFDGSTEIYYSLKADMFVDLTVYTTFHKKVRTLISQHLPAGSFTVYFDGKNQNGDLLSNGLYLYTLKAGDYECTKTMYLGRE